MPFVLPHDPSVPDDLSCGVITRSMCSWLDWTGRGVAGYPYTDDTPILKAPLIQTPANIRFYLYPDWTIRQQETLKG